MVAVKTDFRLEGENHALLRSPESGRSWTQSKPGYLSGKDKHERFRSGGMVSSSGKIAYGNECQAGFRPLARSRPEESWYLGGGNHFIELKGMKKDFSGYAPLWFTESGNRIASHYMDWHFHRIRLRG
jgi:hypothetical protein